MSSDFFNFSLSEYFCPHWLAADLTEKQRIRSRLKCGWTGKSWFPPRKLPALTTEDDVSAKVGRGDPAGRQISPDRQSKGVSNSFLRNSLHCGAGFQPARAGKDARTTNFKAVELRMPSGQGAETALLPIPQPQSGRFRENPSIAVRSLLARDIHASEDPWPPKKTVPLQKERDGDHAQSNVRFDYFSKVIFFVAVN